ncbi:hypothetical protein PMN64_07930 [Bradyrhizobium sp. UFLA01-814]|uniref:hypothetical protein n=1 Tax=Bradyrhizobium sp. UFLA01-814 TaxID=3023480 RepID=UPI00398B1EC7
MTRHIRLLTTHDFFGSFAVVPTSYGELSGGESLRSAVNELRSGKSALWLDSGDFSQGGALTVATNGIGGLRAAGELGIDASVVGNHDLDFGASFLRRHSGALGFPLLSANVDLGLPGTAMIATRDGEVGLIGLTHHDHASMSSWSICPERPMPGAGEGLAFQVKEAAAELRRAGASVVVCICHEGVDWAFSSEGRYGADPMGFFSRCRSWHEAVDLIVAGHTLGRYFGRIGGTPVVQPWPLGAELAILDVCLSGKSIEVSVGAHMVRSTGKQWQGHGANIIRAEQSEVLGHLDRPLIARSGGPAPLATFLAKAVYAASGGADIALAYVTCGQPTLDGVFGWLGAGPISRLQILQNVPYSTFGVVATMISSEELDELRRLTEPRPQDRTTAWGSFGAPRSNKGIVRLATLSGAAADLFCRLLKRKLDWTHVGSTLFDGLKEILATSSVSQRSSVRAFTS